MKYWLVKQEPESYSWQDFVKDGKTAWTGVRNFQARNFLRAMRCDDYVLFYHSVTDKKVVGIAQVTREAYPDPTAKGVGNWACVDLVPIKALTEPVSLDIIKKEPELKEILLIRQSRLSVMPVEVAQFKKVVKMSKTNFSV
ncbi:MAG: EVE domain-containing protein [Verrucomicrobiae bacterium]|nr:EVE domain-containing protein [Verrucomicrobiae bacterium]